MTSWNITKSAKLTSKCEKVCNGQTGMKFTKIFQVKFVPAT